MSRKNQTELDLGLEPLPEGAAPTNLDLSIKAAPSAALSQAQIEFNKRLKALERAQATHDRKRRRLESDLTTCRDVLMPLVEDFNRARYQLVIDTIESARKFKLSKRRREALDDLMGDQVEELLVDPAGLSEEEIAALEALSKEFLGPEPEDEEPTPEEQEMVREEFEALREMLESAAQQSGVELDLDGLDPNGDPDQFLEEMEKRLANAGESFRDAAMGSAPKPKRKRTKAALERERLKQETEEAKKRDFKSLYKQLAKVLHPDLETDPELRSHKEAWMKRLTTARADGDLREMLAIEMEWLGEETGNLVKATDEKLRTYSMVLKEQLAELKERTRALSHQPEFSSLHRFISPHDDSLRTRVYQTKLTGDLAQQREMIAVLKEGGTASRKMINQWADHHANAYGF